MQAGETTTASFTRGPVLPTTLEPPSFPLGTPRDGPNGWWGVWNRQVRQDYRQFAPLHRGSCNILFADGGVRAITDENDDMLLNNGFPASQVSGFADDTVEAAPQELMSFYSLNTRDLP